MKKLVSVLVILTAVMFLANTAFAGSCPQKRKTASAPGGIYFVRLTMAGSVKRQKAVLIR